jgi:superfamily II DNA or RNA helicase
MRYLIPALSRVKQVEVDSVPVSIAQEPLVLGIEVIDEPGGFRVRRAVDPLVSRVFDNGAAIYDGRLCAVEDSALRMEDLAIIRGAGTFFPKEQAIELATNLIPTLQGKVPVTVRSGAIPRTRRIAPRIVIDALADSDGETLTVIPQIVYGDPTIARLRGTGLELISQREVPIRDSIEESRLARDLALRLGLRVGEPAVFSGESAVSAAARLTGWPTTGDGLSSFTPIGDLKVTSQASETSLDIVFESARGGSIAAKDMLSAWQRGSFCVKFSDGPGWAVLPKVWLQQHAEALRRLVDAKERGSTLPARLVAEVSEVCESLEIAAPRYFAQLRAGLERVESIPDATLPKDLTAALRDYQRTGINWISFLNEHGLGALLADDMGLGKTLQALCVVKGKTLIVSPTSVISSWQQQIARFRPGLTVRLYHGPQRTLDPHADVTLTSYAIMRLDRETLCAREWDTLILDEAQTIRNPESQVAQAAYALCAIRRISLSGTPVENSLEDLWSQCNVLNPGLLGTRSEFRDAFSQPIRDGDLSAATRLRKRVAPFIMRRLKRDVAKELPPKTEVVLECELSEQERITYESVLLGLREDLLPKLDQGASTLSILEGLLRLRQACCHVGLLPGHNATTSSKIELLIESLERSISQGHRALVFSQWTSLLDAIEPHITESGFEFSRIDGDTRDRGVIVDRFQRDDGPPIMLLSLKAGGLGITLTKADHVYIVDPWWNPAVEDQAADRAYRIGQENPVLVHRLVAKETIEERIVELQRSKRELLDVAVGAKGAPTLTREDLMALLTPSFQ